MQSSERLKEQMETQVRHLRSTIEVLDLQVQNTLSQKEFAEVELTELRFLKEALGVSFNVLTQELSQPQEQPNPLRNKGIEGAIGRITKLQSQTDLATARTEGALNTWVLLEKQLEHQKKEADQRIRAVEAQSQKAIELALRSEEEEAKAAKKASKKTKKKPAKKTAKKS